MAGERVCVAGERVCMAGGVHGGGHAWQRGACVAGGGGMRGRRRPLQRTVCILLESFLVFNFFSRYHALYLFSFHRKAEHTGQQSWNLSLHVEC